MSTEDEGSEPIRHYQPVHRSEGVTAAERYLKKLCDHSFLSLWSYTGIFRDQGKTGTSGDGKEVCDLLVVFQDHVLIFSDKACAFPDTGRLALDWSRWFRKAIRDSAKQVWGAERWIKDYPNHLFLDRGCKQPFPLALPDLTQARFHRIVVAHDAARRCRRELGGSGSLMIFPRVSGPDHHTPEAEGFTPFAVGHLDPAKGYVHVFDDTTLNIVMQTLDTITDFVSYLTKKEAFITSGRLISAAGEEELLALYLRNLNGQGEHDFVIPPNIRLSIVEGLWEEFDRSPQRQAQLAANKISYAWDRLIEKFSSHIFAGTLYSTSHPGLGDQERIFRFFAREPRTRRRMLSKAIHELLAKTPANQRETRVVLPSHAEDPYYVFAVVPHPESIPDHAKYRETRGELLKALCMVTKLEFPEALDIIGFATEPGISDTMHSEDVVYFDARDWTEDEEAEAKSLQKDLGLLEKLTKFASTEHEYPPVPRAQGPSPRRKPGQKAGSRRNNPCPCGSGRKFKKCCGR